MADRFTLIYLCVTCLVPPLLLSGCLAQKADVQRVERNLDRTVSELGKKEKDLERKIAQAERSIEQQQKKSERLFREARARFRQDLTELREDSISKIHGKLEETDHHLRRHREHLDNLTHRIETLIQVVVKQQAGNEKRLARTEHIQEEQKKKLHEAEQGLRRDLQKTLEHVTAFAQKVDARLTGQDTTIAADRERTDAQAKQFESQTRILAYQISTFRKTLPQFKKALEDLGKELVKGDTELSREMSKQTQAVSAKIDAAIHNLSAHLTEVTHKIDADIKTATSHLGEVARKVETDGSATAKHLAEVNGSVASVAEALKTMSTELVARVDAQDSRFDEAGRRMADVSQSVTLVAEALKTMGAEVRAQVEAQANRQDQTAAHVSEVSNSVTSIAEALTTMSTEVMGRVDAQESRLDQTVARVTEVSDRVASTAVGLETMSAEVVARADARASRLDETAAHVNEVKDSVTSIAEALAATSAAVLGRVEAQESRMEETVSSLRAVTAEVNTLIQTVAQLRETSGPVDDGRRSGDSVSGASAPTAVSGSALGSATASLAKTSDGSPHMVETRARERYEGILTIFKEGDLDGARQGFVEFLAKYPTTTRAPNAQYWLGECYYGKKQYQLAIEAYTRVETEYPQSGKVPAALLKKGYAYLALNDRERGAVVLERVVGSYPGGPEAAKASDRLSRLKGVR